MVYYFCLYSNIQWVFNYFDFFTFALAHSQRALNSQFRWLPESKSKIFIDLCIQCSSAQFSHIPVKFIMHCCVYSVRYNLWNVYGMDSENIQWIVGIPGWFGSIDMKFKQSNLNLIRILGINAHRDFVIESHTQTKSHTHKPSDRLIIATTWVRIFNEFLDEVADR